MALAIDPPISPRPIKPIVFIVVFASFQVTLFSIIVTVKNAEQLHDFIIYYFKGYALKSQFIRMLLYINNLKRQSDKSIQQNQYNNKPTFRR